MSIHIWRVGFALASFLILDTTLSITIALVPYCKGKKERERVGGLLNLVDVLNAQLGKMILLLSLGCVLFDRGMMSSRWFGDCFFRTRWIHGYME